MLCLLHTKGEFDKLMITQHLTDEEKKSKTYFSRNCQHCDLLFTEGILTSDAHTGKEENVNQGRCDFESVKEKEERITKMCNNCNWIQFDALSRVRRRDHES